VVPLDPSDEGPGGSARDFRDDVTIGIVTALPVECAAMENLITDVTTKRYAGDPNYYRVGHLTSATPGRPHRVVLTLMANDNTRNAATVCTDMLRTFPRIRCVVLTGVAGGVPAPDRPEWHVRLGDVVVAVDGIVDYGHVRQLPGAPEPRRPVPEPSADLIRAVRRLQEKAIRGPLPWQRLLAPSRDQPMAVFARPPASTDRLVAGGEPAEHPPAVESGHLNSVPRVHYGRVGCADVLLLDERMRDELAVRHRLIAFEMEAAGVAASVASRGIGWFMVRGIVDYCTEPRTERWYPYASLAAAAYVRALLEECWPFPVLRSAAGSGVLALLPDRELDSLQDLLRTVPELDLSGIWRAAIGKLTPLPEQPPATAMDLVTYLLGLNAGADRVPPALALVEEIAEQVEHRLGSRLRGWVDDVADRQNLTDVLASHRAAARRRQRQDGAPAVQPGLLIQVERDGIDPERCEVRYWIQRTSDGWQPEPGRTRHTPFRHAEQAMQAAVRHAEAVWRHSADPVLVEVLLPTDLLDEAVEWWRTELDEPAPTPLCVDYPVVVRSLDRMRSGHRHRVWVNRWKALWRHPSRHRLYWGRSGSDVDLHGWNARLRENVDLTTVVLSGSPGDDAGYDELRSALNAGIPVILWDRRTPAEPVPAELITRLLHGDPADLPNRVSALRKEAAVVPEGTQRFHTGRHLALLWDDPTRTVHDGGPRQ
jgi:nucleoside phosphorylase